MQLGALAGAGFVWVRVAWIFTVLGFSVATVGVCACDAIEENQIECAKAREEQVKEAKADYARRMKEAYKVIDDDLPLSEYCKAVAEKAVPCRWNRFGELDVPCLEDQALAESTCREMGNMAREKMRESGGKYDAEKDR